MQSTMTKEDIVRLLYNAFPVSPVPSQLFPDGICDVTGNDLLEDMQKQLLGRTWTEVTLEDWQNTASIPVVMGCITPAAFHFYLPSVILATLEKPEWLQLGVEALIPNNQWHVPRGEWWKAYFLRFSPEQRTAICLYLAYAADVVVPGSIEAAWIPIAQELFCGEMQG